MFEGKRREKNFDNQSVTNLVGITVSAVIRGKTRKNTLSGGQGPCTACYTITHYGIHYGLIITPPGRNVILAHRHITTHSASPP